MEFTLRSYLGNPYGKGNSTVPNFSSIREIYLNKLYQIESSIVVKWYQYKEKSYICHLLIPSESVKGVHYDVVFEFEFPSNDTMHHNMLDLPLKVFSNAPSFSYTYAHVFLKEKLLCEWLKNKYGKIIRQNTAMIRNSSNVIGLEKSLFISALFLSMKGRSEFSYVNSIAEKISSTNIVETKVLSQDSVENKYRDIKKQLRIQKEMEKKHAKEIKKDHPSIRKDIHTKSIEKMSKTSHTELKNSTKLSKKSKRIKKI